MGISRGRSRVRLSPSCAGLRMTPEEFDGVLDFDERYRYELINGVLVVTPPPGLSERDPTRRRQFQSGEVQVGDQHARMLEPGVYREEIPQAAGEQQSANQ